MNDYRIRLWDNNDKLSFNYSRKKQIVYIYLKYTLDKIKKD